MRDEPPKGASESPKAPGDKALKRRRRQAEALRRNLKKRKEQARERQKPGTGIADED